MTVIRIDKVHKRVPVAGGKLDILTGVSLQVPAGQFVGIVGQSGSGKSTLLGLIAGLDHVSAGRIHLGDDEITDLGEDQLARLRARRIGFVFQSYNLVANLTAVENVALPMEIVGRRDAPARARSLLAEVGLAARLGHYPAQLSGGEQQRVAIARAFANEPEVLLADEPTGNLDSHTGEHIIALLEEWNRARKTTMLMATHDPQLAAAAERRVELRDGRIIADSHAEAGDA